jgi:cytoskeleton protein RodZ
MTEFNDTPTAHASEGVAGLPSASPTAGGLLRQARENAGMHLGMLSVSLKVPVRNLMALEADQYALLSGPVFVRALANSVCRHLKIDSSAILALLPPASNRLEPMNPGLGSSQTDSFVVLWRQHVMANRKFLILALAMVILISLVSWLPSWPIASIQSVLRVTAVTPAIEPFLSSVTLVPSEPAVSTATKVDLPEPSKETASVTGEPVEQASQEIDLMIKGKSDAWVEVKNSTGALIFNQLVKKGETHRIKGELILSVVVGNAEGVELQVRGKAFDLTPFIRGPVARFEVK